MKEPIRTEADLYEPVKRSASIVQRDYYGWFVRVEHGTYALTAAGREGLTSFAPAMQEPARDRDSS
jgi:hypothetical protein